MQKLDLDHLLEKAVADAIGVKLTPHRRLITPRPRHKMALPVQHHRTMHARPRALALA